MESGREKIRQKQNKQEGDGVDEKSEEKKRW